MAEQGLAILVPNGLGVLNRVRKRGWIPIYGQPHELKIPGAVVVIVSESGACELIANATELEGPVSGIRPIGSQKTNAYKLHLTRIRTLRDAPPLRIKWYAFGQFRYFDPRSWSGVIVGDIVAAALKSLATAEASGVERYTKRAEFSGGVPGRPLSHPESQLVKRYVDWLCVECEQHRLMPDGFETDLFDAGKWRLIEAKVAADRATLRAAVGQLLDYRRFYARSPSVAVLTAAKPAKRCLDFLTDRGVVAVWETPGGQFRDSAFGTWSIGRRTKQ